MSPQEKLLELYVKYRAMEDGPEKLAFRQKYDDAVAASFEAGDFGGYYDAEQMKSILHASWLRIQRSNESNR